MASSDSVAFSDHWVSEQRGSDLLTAAADILIPEDSSVLAVLQGRTCKIEIWL